MKYLFYLFSCVVFDKEIQYEKSVDYERMFKICRRHSIANTLYYAIANDPYCPENIKEKFLEHWFSMTNVQARQINEMNRILEKFNENKIYILPLKGWEMKNFYSEPNMRSSCDVDFLIDKEQTSKALNIIEQLGFEFSHSTDNHYVYSKDVVVIECHIQPMCCRCAVNRSEYFSDFPGGEPIEKGSYILRQSNEDLYIYMLAHMFKHMVSGGFGIRQVLDIYVLLNNPEFSLDKEYIATAVKSAGLADFEYHIKKLCDIWFCGAQSSDFYDNFTAFILRSGVTGTRTNLNIFRIVSSDTAASMRSNKFKLMLYHIYPPRSVLKNNYPLVEKHPALIPFFQIKRHFDVLFKRRKDIDVLKNIHSVKQSDTLNAIEILNKVGYFDMNKIKSKNK